MATVTVKAIKTAKKPARTSTRPAAARQRKTRGNGAIHAMAADGVAHDGLDGHGAQPMPARSSAAARAREAGSLMERGKDLLAAEAGGVATAAAIVVGAALIELELIPGLLIGAGAILLGKFFPQMGDYVRPAVKGAVRAGFAVTHKAREVMAEASEQVQDMVAEVRHEQDKGHRAPAARPARAGARAPARAAASADSHLPVH